MQERSKNSAYNHGTFGVAMEVEAGGSLGLDDKPA